MTRQRTPQQPPLDTPPPTPVRKRSRSSDSEDDNNDAAVLNEAGFNKKITELQHVMHCFREVGNQWSSYAQLMKPYNERWPLAGPPSKDPDTRIRTNCGHWNKECLAMNLGAKAGHDEKCLRKDCHAICQAKNSDRQGGRGQDALYLYRVEPGLAALLNLSRQRKRHAGPPASESSSAGSDAEDAGSDEGHAECSGCEDLRKRMDELSKENRRYELQISLLKSERDEERRNRNRLG